MSFVHLHVHSHFSLLDGLSKIDSIIALAKQYEMPAVALTDHGVMYGAIEFYQKCLKHDIKPIIGVESYVAPNGHTNKQSKTDALNNHLVLLAKNLTGYKNLIKLTTIAHLEGFYYKPRIDLELLKQHSEGIIILSACLKGEIPQIILSGDLNKAEQRIYEYQKIVGEDNYFLEVQSHPKLPEQGIVNQGLFELSKKTGVPIVATNDAHYPNHDDADAHDILICLQTKRKKSDTDRMNLLDVDASFCSPNTMRAAFPDHPEVLANTLKVADMCNLDIPLGEIQLPYFEVPKEHDPDSYLRALCEQNISKLYPKVPPELAERLDYELSIIGKTGYASYFLIVQDFINWAKAQGIIVGPGRGSAAGSLVAFLTRITNIDPLKYDLLFERFLNPERVSMPDIDIDFADTRRDEVIAYAANKYGHDKVAQIITFGTMAARVVVRDVGRVLGAPYSLCDRIAKLIPMFTSLDEAMDVVPELKALYQEDDLAQSIIDAAHKLEGGVRHTSTHACGVVITKNALTEYVPLQYSSTDDNTVVTQYPMGPVEALGLLKMDFLGLKNLTLLEAALRIIQKIHTVTIDIENLPLDDAKTFALLQDANTTGVFQLESAGMKRYLKMLKPTEIEDIIVMVSLYRPGPMEFIPDYIGGKHGTREVTYLNSKLEPILGKTYGIAVYQEQIMQIARDLAGFTYGEADVLRKAVGKKIKKLLDEQEIKIIKGMVNGGIDQDTAKQIWEFILPFARYGFNRSHAACYAMIAYQTAYLKANYPVEFMAALLTADQENMDRVTIEIEECRKIGIEVLAPDVNESFSDFTVVAESLATDTPRIRFGLTAIKNLGGGVIKAIIKERKANGKYTSLADLLFRVHDKDVNKKSLESMIKSGALNSLGDQGQMLHNLDMLINYNKRAKQESLSGQTSLFGMIDESAPPLHLSPAEQIPTEEQLSWEKFYLGLYITNHPMNAFKPYLQNIGITLCDALPQHVDNTIQVIGVVTKLQRIITKKGDSMLFATLEDHTSPIEVLIFPKLLATTQHIWIEGTTILVTGRVSDKDGEHKLLGESVKPINLNHIKKVAEGKIKSITRSDFIIQPEGNQIVLYLPIEPTTILTEQLKQYFTTIPGPYTVRLQVKGTNSVKKIATDFSISYNESIRQRVHELLAEQLL